jgi:cobalamin biosynthesis protein CobD/CbiB
VWVVPFAIGCGGNGKPCLACTEFTRFFPSPGSTSRRASGKVAPAVTNARFIIQVSKGLIRNLRTRRLIMFYGVIIALVLLFAGTTLLWNFLRDHPFVFLAYWAVCAWITLLAVLLAIYDILRVRAEARKTVRRMQEEFMSQEDEPDDTNPR